MSKIEWTQQTWNPLGGCSMVSPGCTNCYAMTMARRLELMGSAKYEGLTVLSGGRAKWSGKVILDETALLAPLRRKKPTTYFVNSMSDLFHESVPDEWIDRIFAVMALCPQHTFQVLTKRARRMREYLTVDIPDYWIASNEKKVPGERKDVVISAAQEIGSEEQSNGEMRFSEAQVLSIQDRWPLPNVWLGVSAEQQPEADERIPILLQTPAAIRFVSAEPLLGEISMRGWLIDEAYKRIFGVGKLDWVIVGGESGPGARPCNVEWIRSIVRQCQTAGVAVFVKQLGAVPVATQVSLDEWPSYVRWEKHPNLDAGTPSAQHRLKHQKGGDMSEWPEDLRVRQMPGVPVEAADAPAPVDPKPTKTAKKKSTKPLPGAVVDGKSAGAGERASISPRARMFAWVVDGKSAGAGERAEPAGAR